MKFRIRHVVHSLSVLFYSSREGKLQPKRDIVIPGDLEDDADYLLFV